jgi:hypothetical protein
VPRHDITAALGASPPSRISSQPDEPPPRGREERVHLPDEPALQLVLVLDAERRMRAWMRGLGAPQRLVGLVAADVHVRPREQREHLGEHVLHERDRARLGVEDVAEHAPPPDTGVGRPVTPELG